MTIDDLIKRQDAVKSMTNAIWHYPNEMYAQLNSYEMAEALAKDGLMFIPSAQQWIPWVDNDDRLKNHYYYLVTHVGIEIPMLAKFHDDGCYFEIISMYPHKSVYVWENDIITAWMPLPEIYKGKE